MSYIAGAETLMRQFETLDQAVDRNMAEEVPIVAEEMRQTMASLVRRRTGRLAGVIESEEFVKKFASRRNGVSVEVGFRTSEIRRQARHAFYLEFGTKRHETGGRRYAGRRRKSGKQAFKRVNRGSPQRPAYPFYRPAYAMMIENMRKRRLRAWGSAVIEAAADKATS